VPAKQIEEEAEARDISVVGALRRRNGNWE
jgi:hypothetical protein